MIIFSILYWGTAYTAGLLAMGIYLVLYFKRKDIYFFNVAIFNINMLAIVFSFFLLVVLQSPIMSVESVINIMLLFSCSTLIYILPRWILTDTDVKSLKILRKIFLAASIISVILVMTINLFKVAQHVATFVLFCMTISIIFSIVYGAIKEFPEKNKKLNIVSIVVYTIFIPSLIILNFFPSVLYISEEFLLYFHVLPGFYTLLSIQLLFDLKGRFWNKKINYDSFIQARGITPREKEVMQLVLNGDSYQSISDKMCISLSTVKTHISNIFKKTETANKVELMALIHKESN